MLCLQKHLSKQAKKNMIAIFIFSTELSQNCSAYRPAAVSDGGRVDSVVHYIGPVHLPWSTASGLCR